MVRAARGGDPRGVEAALARAARGSTTRPKGRPIGNLGERSRGIRAVRTEELAERIRKASRALDLDPRDVLACVSSLVASGWSPFEALWLAIQELPISRRRLGAPAGWIRDPLRAVWIGPDCRVVSVVEALRLGVLPWEIPDLRPRDRWTRQVRAVVRAAWRSWGAFWRLAASVVWREGWIR